MEQLDGDVCYDDRMRALSFLWAVRPHLTREQSELIENFLTELSPDEPDQ